MKDSLAPGLEHELRFVVPVTKTVPHLYPESPEFAAMPEVFATGFMVGFIEWACLEAIAPHLEDGEMSLGVHISLSHDAATPPGMEVVARVRLEAVNGRRLTFAVEAHRRARAHLRGLARALRGRPGPLRRGGRTQGRLSPGLRRGAQGSTTTLVASPERARRKASSTSSSGRRCEMRSPVAIEPAASSARASRVSMGPAEYVELDRDLPEEDRAEVERHRRAGSRRGEELHHAGRAGQVERAGDGVGVAGADEDLVRQGAEGVLDLAQVAGGDRDRPGATGQLAPVRAGLDGHHPLRSGGQGGGDLQQAHRARAHHRDAREPGPTPAQRWPRSTQPRGSMRVASASLMPLGQREHVEARVLGRDADQLRQASRVDAGAPEGVAERVAPRPAERAGHAGHVVVHEDPLAHRHRRAGAGVHHLARRLVPQHHGGARVLVPRHQVAAAEPAGPHAHHQLAGARHGVGPLLEGHPPGTVVERDPHGVRLPVGRARSGEGAEAGDLPPHDQGVDDVGALHRGDHLHVAQVPADLVVEQDPVAAQQVAGLPDHGLRALGVVHLGERCDGRRSRPASTSCARRRHRRRMQVRSAAILARRNG